MVSGRTRWLSKRSPARKIRLGLALPGGVGQAGEELALLLPALCRLVGGQGVEGGV